MTLAYESACGKRLLTRHPENMRMQKQVLNQYVQGILTQGAIPGVRGDPVAVEGDETDCYLLVAGGTMTDAVFEAKARQPVNIYVAETLRQGLCKVTILHKRTPRDVIRWLKKYYNSFHFGSGYSFLELLEDMRSSMFCFSHCQLFKFVVYYSHRSFGALNQHVHALTCTVMHACSSSNIAYFCCSAFTEHCLVMLLYLFIF